ncbi:MAG: P-loop NTPase [Termitinemataceae bacterium]
MDYYSGYRKKCKALAMELLYHDTLTMAVLLPVASGKGGVGKSIVAANLAVALALHGKTTILVDLDLGASNLHTLLGIKNRYNGIGAFVYRQETSLEALLKETEISHLFFIPGDTLLPGTANMDFFVKQKIIRLLYQLPADYIIMDLGAGSAYNTVDFFLSSSSGLIVTIGESTAILNAYSFLKTLLYRALQRSFPPRSPARGTITTFFSKKIEGTSETFPVLEQQLLSSFGQEAQKAIEQVKGLYPRIILNMSDGPQDLQIGIRLREIAAKNLRLGLEYIACLPRDPAVIQSVAVRRPVLLLAPDCPFSSHLRALADRLIAHPEPHVQGARDPLSLFPGNEDILAASHLQA